MHRSSWRRWCTMILCALLLLHTVNASDCTYMLGCVSCTDQRTQQSAPILPGYKFAPYSVRDSSVGIAASSYMVNDDILQTSDAQTETTTGSLAAALRSAGDAFMGMKRSLLELRSDVSFSAHSTAPEQQTAKGSAGGAVVGFSVQGSSKTSNSDRGRTSSATVPKEAHSSSLRSLRQASLMGDVAAGQAQMSASTKPLVLAPPSLHSQLAGQVPLTNPEMTPEQQYLDILTTDPTANGPHPWDVLLFKTDQFNTTRPAYRLGGLGLMLMADFNKSQPLTDWHTMNTASSSVQQQQQGSGGDWSGGSNIQSVNIPTAEHGQAGSVFGQLGNIVRQAVGSTKSTKDIKLESSANAKPTSLVEQLKGMLQKLNRAGVSNKDNAAFSIASAEGPKRLWCTACWAPAYRLTEFGHCACAPGYGRVLDSSNPYSCVACPPGQVASTAAVAGSQQPGASTDIRQQQPGAVGLKPAAEFSTLSVCQLCPQGSVPNQDRTACVVP